MIHFWIHFKWQEFNKVYVVGIFTNTWHSQKLNHKTGYFWFWCLVPWRKKIQLFGRFLLLLILSIINILCLLFIVLKLQSWKKWLVHFVRFRIEKKNHLSPDTMLIRVMLSETLPDAPTLIWWGLVLKENP